MFFTLYEDFCSLRHKVISACSGLVAECSSSFDPPRRLESVWRTTWISLLVWLVADSPSMGFASPRSHLQQASYPLCPFYTLIYSDLLDKFDRFFDNVKAYQITCSDIYIYGCPELTKDHCAALFDALKPSEIFLDSEGTDQFQACSSLTGVVLSLHSFYYQ